MPKTIRQKVVFKNSNAGNLYAMFLNSKHHTKLTGGSTAKISAKEGAKFSAHNGYCFGKNLELVKNKLIVQSWRGSDWKKTDTDSTFVLHFEQKGKNAVLSMVHANIPNEQLKQIFEGWKDFYWKPWKEYLKHK
jgi:activator of HSP90 ATPase